MLQLLRGAASDLHGAFGIGSGPVPAAEIEARRRQAREIESRLSANVPLSPVTSGEVCWIYARALRRASGERAYDQFWEPPRSPTAEPSDPPAVDRPRAVLAQLTDAVVKEGGYKDDPDRPRHRRYVRVDGPGGTSYQTVLALADMPHLFAYPERRRRVALPRRRGRLPGRLVRADQGGPERRCARQGAAQAARPHRAGRRVRRRDDRCPAAARRGDPGHRSRACAARGQPHGARAAGHHPALDRSRVAGRARGPGCRARPRCSSPRSTASPARPVARSTCCARCSRARPPRPSVGTTRSSC